MFAHEPFHAPILITKVDFTPIRFTLYAKSVISYNVVVCQSDIDVIVRISEIRHYCNMFIPAMFRAVIVMILSIDSQILFFFLRKFPIHVFCFFGGVGGVHGPT